jgi:hypothetical protein
MAKKVMAAKDIGHLVSKEDGIYVVNEGIEPVQVISGQIMYEILDDYRVVTTKAGDKIKLIDSMRSFASGVSSAEQPSSASRVAVSGRPSKEFLQAVVDHTNAYLFENTEPPAEIAPAIKNISDDYVGGREMIFRAGDYISIQNYIRNKGK